MAAMVVLWSCDLMVMWPVWSDGNIEGTTCRIGDDNYGYLAFDCGCNFSMVAMLIQLHVKAVELYSPAH